jgi:peptide/nickel transport system substrate-binding protein
MKIKSKWSALGLASLGVLVLAGALAAATASGGSGQTAATKAYPRSETLYTGGTQWGNIVGFNPYVGNYAAGMVGLVNETLVRYDPLTDKYIPWLAKSATWSSPKVFKIVVRSGVKWSDGTAFTAADVKWNVDLGRFSTIPWHNLYTGISSVAVSGSTVTVTFKGTPKYQEWQNALWAFMAMIQPNQWQSHANDKDITTWSPTDPIGTGPYVLDKSGYDPTTRVVWKKNPVGWWAAKAGLSPSPKPNYVIDLVNSSNNVALSLMLSGQEDLNNNYLPGISKLLSGGYGLSTYYTKAPYNLSANTAWLLPNTQKAPTSDVNFRKALAYGIDVDALVSVDYANLAKKASPTGLLPTWDKYIDASLVKQYGFSYNPKKAVQILTAAGYKKGSDGYFRQPNGKSISLKLAVPSGWSDWMQAIQMISSDLKKIGIKVTPTYPDFNTYQQAQRNAGKFDLMIDNAAGGGTLTDTPWTYYNYLFHLPILKSQTNFNFERYTNRAAWNLVQKLDTTPKSDVAGMKAIIKQLQKITMQQLPEIPLWYNGVWAQMSSQYWTNWPSASSTRNYIPAMWRGYLQLTGIDMITHLSPAKPAP